MKKIEDHATLNGGVFETSGNGLQPETGGFDLDSLRLTQNFAELVGVKKALLTVPVRKPGRQDFIRVRPGDEWCFQAAILELKEDRASYLVDCCLWLELPGEIVPKILFTTINRQGVLSLWPVRLPGTDGRQDHWSSSALEAAEMAKTRWIRLAANMSLGAYEVFYASSDIPDPVWPDAGFEEIMRIAFKDQFIKSLDHPVIRRLRGDL